MHSGGSKLQNELFGKVETHKISFFFLICLHFGLVRKGLTKKLRDFTK